jgi:hypothetical protein
VCQIHFTIFQESQKTSFNSALDIIQKHLKLRIQRLRTNNEWESFVKNSKEKNQNPFFEWYVYIYAKTLTVEAQQTTTTPFSLTISYWISAITPVTGASIVMLMADVIEVPAATGQEIPSEAQASRIPAGSSKPISTPPT